jgi:hypothetical protein
MDIEDVPQPLAERLGNGGTRGLVALLDRTKAEWTDGVLTTAVDRFDRRLATEISAMRIDFAREMSSFRQDVHRELSASREGFTRELNSVRVEVLKWSFLFWIGQVAAIAGLLAFMLEA